MNRKLQEKIERLESKLSRALREGEREHGDMLRLWTLLNNLLKLEPSLTKYHQVEGRWEMLDWDYEGVAQAVKFRAEESVADKYAPKASA